MASSPLAILVLVFLLTVSVSSAIERTKLMEKTELMETAKLELAPSPHSPIHWEEQKFNIKGIFKTIGSWFKPKPKSKPGPAPKRKGFDVSHCWKSLTKVAVCRARFELARRFKSVTVGEDCCNSALEVGVDCFAKMGEWVAPLIAEQCK